jgi:hypothetical protein
MRKVHVVARKVLLGICARKLEVEEQFVARTKVFELKHE